LDFGTVERGQALWLEVSVNGSALNPRQKLTAAPSADTLRPGAVITGTTSSTTLEVGNGNNDGVALCGKMGYNGPCSSTDRKSNRPDIDVGLAVLGIDGNVGGTAILGIGTNNLGVGVQGNSDIDGVGVGGTVGGAATIVANTGVAGLSLAN